MASNLLRLLFPCCVGRRSAGVLDEETRLLDPDILPEAPAQYQRTTEHQQAEQEALRRILNEASERFVNIESPNPFSRQSPYSSRSASPDPSDYHKKRRDTISQVDVGAGSIWRALDTSVKVVHVGTNFEPHDSSHRKKYIANDRPSSAHSLKTLPRNLVTPNPSPLASKTGISNEGSSRFGTVRSYRTATEGDSSDAEQEGSETREDTGMQAASDVTTHGYDDQEISALRDETQAAELKRKNDLRKAIDALEESIDRFKVQPTGPLVESLSSSA